MWEEITSVVLNRCEKRRTAEEGIRIRVKIRFRVRVELRSMLVFIIGAIVAGANAIHS